MIIRLWHNRRSRITPIDDETGEPLYGYILAITPGDNLIEAHYISNWPDEAMPNTSGEAAAILKRVCEALDAERISLHVGDAVQIQNRFWACEVIDPVTHARKWSGLPLNIRMLMYWTKLSHSKQAPCSCAECLELVRS
jgi:hypothetical protein